MVAVGSLPSGSLIAQPTAAGLPDARRFGLEYKWQVLLCTVIGTFMTMLDSTIVNIALPKMAAVFAVSLSDVQLVVTSYMLALAVIIPATGYLSDTLGVKRLYLVTMALFTGGSLLCGLAWSNDSMIAFRIIQGLGGGMMGPLGMTMLYKAVPLKERNSVMGLYGVPLILAPVLGPTLGGYIVEYLDWRIIFTLNVPLGIIGILLGSAMLRESEIIRNLIFDWKGFILSALGFSTLLLGLSDGTSDGWTSTKVEVLIATGVISLIAWVWVELSVPQPLVELRLFADSTFSIAMAVTFVLTIGLFGSQLLVPVFLQSYRGLGAAEAGLITMAQALAILPMMPLAGRLTDRFGARPLLLIGLPLVALSNWQFTSVDLSTSDWTLRWMLAFRGVTLGLVMMPSMTTAMNAAPAHLLSRASSLTNVSRQVFGSFGAAIFVTLLQSRMRFHQAVLTQGATPDNFAIAQMFAQAQQWVASQGGSGADGQRLAMLALYKQLMMTVAVEAFQDVYRVVAALTLFAVVPALLLRSVRRARPKDDQSASPTPSPPDVNTLHVSHAMGE